MWSWIFIDYCLAPTLNILIPIYHSTKVNLVLKGVRLYKVSLCVRLIKSSRRSMCFVQHLVRVSLKYLIVFLNWISQLRLLKFLLLYFHSLMTIYINDTCSYLIQNIVWFTENYKKKQDPIRWYSPADIMFVLFSCNHVKARLQPWF